ncbi:hypothetical protein CFHF_22080 [Caulobacter flavus]|uniref:DUF1508 domain-containing protein n=1 Tax=Caulobacter flavus TaxID=1679497 RepID=A0A2N5CN98_9CAUL|nr:DUF1508 domain-containing protein [Caulobacter flavus]AYV46680.1 hypothetical protein C1707_10605 [Caulobacter flavus]PLR07916.1 hypothetical protein CFHF_22080 [Caulobacter flavus]
MTAVTYPCYWQYKDAQGQWRWTYYASNGRAISVASESYINRADCTRSIEIMQASQWSPVFFDSKAA